MSLLSTVCPHCYRENVEFRSMGLYQHIMNIKIYTVLFKCGHCEKSINVTVKSSIEPDPHNFEGNIQISPRYHILEIYPKPTEPKTPPHLPDNIRNFYLQAVSSIRLKNWDASAIMSRKVLEIATKTLDPQISGGLKKRINELASKTIIPESIKDWAHQIRLEGNIAAHEDKPVEPKDAEDILSFTELFLMYTFTLPGMLEERKSKLADS